MALLGTGLASVALALMAFDLAPDRAARVLATVLTIKMLAYVFVAPLAQGVLGHLPRRQVLIALDIMRALAVAGLFFATDTWQIYGLIFLMQAASAGFTPTFQATIPDILTDEDTYTQALSLSRLAYDLESLISPVLAAMLLFLLPPVGLFILTGVGFIASALLIKSVSIPSIATQPARSFKDRLTRGSRIYLATPRLRGLLALNLSIAAIAAMVLVNTVVLVQQDLHLSQQHVAFAIAAFGGGSMLIALILPMGLRHWADRNVMIWGAVGALCSLVMLLISSFVSGLTWGYLLISWAGIGMGFSAVMTPSGRLLRRSAHIEDRSAVFAAQFALSHMCWLITYPLAGVLMTGLGTSAALIGLACVGAIGIGIALMVWHGNLDQSPAHAHPELAPDHPHLQGAGPHHHPIVIDDLHHHWPRMP
ncbi:MFS transporter [Aestuariibius sp. HNIBRBA575]|uniref:MFS transporter n=1 Tax=Aestuariibius sp. HNIBRBA575 TaxID=3233343 RepID=UPI0034A399EC